VGLIAALVLGLTLIVTSPAQAIIIDTFDDSAVGPTGGFKPDTLGGNPLGSFVNTIIPTRNITDGNPLGATLSSSRDGFLSMTNGSGPIFAFVPELGGGSFNASSSNSTTPEQGSVSLEYDAVAGFQGGVVGGGLGADLSGQTDVVIDFQSFNSGDGSSLMPVGNEIVTMTLVDDLGNIGSITGRMLTGPLLLSLLGPEFSALDLTSIDRIVFDFELNNGTDFQIDMIETQAVPEPLAIAVWFICAAALYVARQRSRLFAKA
jgi:hypothetical protein